MAYTEFDWHLDNIGSGHNGSFCEACVTESKQEATKKERERWFAALRGNWTCLGCGAEIGPGMRLTLSEGCDRCKPIREMIDGKNGCT